MKDEKDIKRNDIQLVGIGTETIGRTDIGVVNLGGGVKGTSFEHNGIGYWTIGKDFKVS